MATTRIKDIAGTATTFPSDAVLPLDGTTNGTQKITIANAVADIASDIKADPGTHGLCPLNGSNKIDAAYLPTSADTPKGEWNANTNSPTLADGTGTAGDYYDVTTAGSSDLGSGSITFTVGDIVKYDGSVWYKVDSVSNILDGNSTASQARTTLSVNSIDEAAQLAGQRVVGPSVYLDGVDDYITIADSGVWSFTDGTDDYPFSVEAWVCMQDATDFTFACKFPTSAANREWLFRTDSSDLLELNIRDTSANVAKLSYDTAMTSYEGQWVHVCATYGGSGPSSQSGTAFSAAANEMDLYINGVSVTSGSTATNNGSYAGMTDGTSAVNIGVYNDPGSGTFSHGHIYRVKIHNRQLSATEVQHAARSGANPNAFSDEWAKALGTTDTSDFSAGADSYAGTSMTVTGNIDAIGGEDDTLRAVPNTASGVHYISKSVLTVGKRYRITGDVYIDSSNSNIDGLQVYAGAFSSTKTPSTDTWTKFDFEVLATQTDLRIYATDGGNTSFQDAGGDDLIYFKNIYVTPIGVQADYSGDNWNDAEGTWEDASSSNLDGTNNGAALTGAKKHLSLATISLSGLQTSSAGLSSGSVWANSNVLTVVP